MGYQVQPYDKVEFEGQLIKNEAKVYIVLNKPKDVISAVSDERGERTVIDIVRNCCVERLPRRPFRQANNRCFTFN